MVVKHLLPVLLLLLGTFKLLLPGLFVCLVAASLPTLPLWIKSSQGRSRMLILASSWVSYSFPCVTISSFFYTHQYLPRPVKSPALCHSGLKPTHHSITGTACPPGAQFVCQPQALKIYQVSSLLWEQKQAGRSSWRTQHSPAGLAGPLQFFKGQVNIFRPGNAPWSLTPREWQGVLPELELGRLWAALGCSSCWTLPFLPQTGSLTSDK